MKVGVVGLGLAGLRTAMLLERSGAEVELFEARSRPGGRLFTLADDSGTVYEAGAEWIDGDHLRMLRLLSELRLSPETPAEWPKKVVYGGEHSTEAFLWADAMEDDLRVEAAARELCRDLAEPPWRNTHLADLDRRTLSEFLAEHSQSSRGLWYVTAQYRSDEGEDPEHVGLLGWLCGYLHYLDRDGDVMSKYRFAGGASLVAERMLSSLRGQAHFNTELRRVRHTPDAVTLEFDNGRVTVDRAVIAVPPPALELVCFDPPLSVEKRCAIEASRVGRVVKLALEFQEPWWRDLDWGGSMLCDTPLQQTWDGTLGERPVLSAYVCGESACHWTAQPNPAAAAAEELSVIFPEAAGCFRRGWLHDWVGDRYARGGFAHLPPRYVLDHMPHIAPPEGRIHFAGEHTALWTGFMEGAIESAERVAAEVHCMEASK